MKRIGQLSDADFKKAFLEERLAKRPKATENVLLAREKGGSASDISGNFQGPWAKYVGEESAAGHTPAELFKYTAEKAAEERVLKVHHVIHGKERSILHREYSVVADEVPDVEVSRLPAGKCRHTLIGHTKAVSSLSFLPKSGNLILSASMDGHIKLWQTPQDGDDIVPCVRTLYGHNKAVKGAFFDPSGLRISSFSFDKYVKVWDTASGQCTAQLKHKKLPYSAAFLSEDAMLVGIDDGTIMQWDLRTGQAVLEYSEHTKAVNCLLAISRERFVSGADDCSLTTWEVGTQVPKRSQKYRELDAFSQIAKHPKEPSVILQCLSEKVAAFSLEEDKGVGLRLSDNYRIFEGHGTKGYSCQTTCSPDGRFLASGDGKGNAVFWDWRSGQLARTIKAHDEACVAVDWHPWRANHFVTGSWDATIKYWC